MQDVLKFIAQLTLQQILGLTALVAVMTAGPILILKAFSNFMKQHGTAGSQNALAPATVQITFPDEFLSTQRSIGEGINKNLTISRRVDRKASDILANQKRLKRIEEKIDGKARGGRA